MTTLKDLINNETTDKNTKHFYLDSYEELFKSKKDAEVNILEVGIYQGGSIKLWRDYFTNGRVYGVDIIDRNHPYIREPSILSDPRITLYTSINAYDQGFVNSILKSTKFDFLIDDGPHTYESVEFFVKYYLPLLKDDGILVVEDIQSPDWLPKLSECVPEEYKGCIKIVDVRNVKDRYDDLMFIVDLNSRQLSS